ncbi:tRNA-dihydrouridine synthase [Vibrio stylophorae]
MEGVVDGLMRDFITRLNPYDLCVTEFVRVVDLLLPERVYYRLAPELLQGGKTTAGTPVRVQLLGQDPNWLAENANRAAALGSPGVDLNFGCPAKNVNRSQGGASLLKNPQQIYQIIHQVRQALPADVTLSAKIRLGWDSIESAQEIFDAVISAGANELTVHGRTKEDGYHAPANWPAIGKLVAQCPIPLIANGDIVDATTAKQCMEQTGTPLLMVGRGAIEKPNLGAMIQSQASLLPWFDFVHAMVSFHDEDPAARAELFHPSRVKQWLRYLKVSYPQAQQLFVEFRSLRTIEEMHAGFRAHYEQLLRTHSQIGEI